VWLAVKSSLMAALIFVRDVKEKEQLMLDLYKKGNTCFIQEVPFLTLKIYSKK
jgi:hypothetical protein